MLVCIIKFKESGMIEFNSNQDEDQPKKAGVGGLPTYG